MKRKKRKK